MNLDSHQHFWIYNQSQYGWMDPDRMAPLRRDFLPSDLNQAQAGTGLDGSIVVQARQSVDEARWLLQLAQKSPRIRGVVGWVDLRSPRLSNDLKELCQDPKFVGVRHVLQDEPDDRFMLGAEFVRGIGQLQEFGLAYDLLIFPRQLEAAIELVKKFPQQHFVLDHLAKPFIKDRLISPWKEQIHRLAGAPNVWCKVSGMVTEAHWSQWKPKDFKPFLDVVFEAFAPDRLMFGSDWPVCLLAGSYAQVVQLVRDYIQSMPAQAQAGIFGRNAAAFYGVDGGKNDGVAG